MIRSIVFLFFLFQVAWVNKLTAQHAKWASHGIRKIETRTTELKDSAFTSRTVELINRKGKVLESWEWGKEEKLLKHTVNKYSKWVFESKIYDKNDSLKIREYVLYDKKGREIERKTNQLRENLIRKTIISYDKWGNKTSELLFINDKIEKQRLYFYNNEGILERQITKNADGKIVFEKTFQLTR